MNRSAAPRRTIAHILPWPSVGGTEHGAVRIAQSIDADRFTSIAFCLPDAEPVRALFAAAGVPCVTYVPAAHSYRHGGAFLRASLALARALRRNRVDLVHCSDLLAAYYAGIAGRVAGLPIISHIRGRFDTISRRDRSFLWPVRKFIFVSRNTWEHFGHRVPLSRGVVVYDGIDVPEETGALADSESVRRELDLPTTAPLIGMFARVAPPKDYATLARAAARVLPLAPSARFLVVGDYTSTEVHRRYYEDVRRVLDECGVAGSFIFTGYRSDVARFLNAVDVFVLSSHWEGLPLVILEAMARGRPVIATGVDGIPEVVHHGETGLLFPREDHSELAAHILAVLRDRALASRLGASGRRLVRERFSTRQFGESMSAVYAEVLGLHAR